MTRQLIIIFSIALNSLLCQTTLTKDSFFLEQKSFPVNYKSIITETQWMYLGFWQSNIKKVYTPDTIKPFDLMLFENKPVRRYKHPNRKVVYTSDTSSLWKTVMAYHKIKGNKIISKNTDLGTQKIIYIDNSTLILEDKSEKTVYRFLYRRQP